MFSGLIGFRGTVVANEDRHGGRHLVISAPDAIAEGIEPKDSIAVNGVCLTATSVGKQRIAFDVVPETIGRTTLSALHEGDKANIELALKMGDRFGGHFVYGHVDATAIILERRPEGEGERIVIATPPSLARYIIEKGYIAIDGVSLTIAAVEQNRFEIALIPETAARTTLGDPARKHVNVEVDPIARYALGEAPMPTLTA